MYTTNIVIQWNYTSFFRAMDLFGRTSRCTGAYYEQIQKTYAAAHDEKKRCGCPISFASTSDSVCGKKLQCSL